jgi:transporter family-2 protein
MLYAFFAAFTGAVISLMVAVNGELANASGVYTATLLIYLTGLAATLVFCIVRRVAVLPRRGVAFYWYCGGFIGLAITLCNNLSYGKISMSAIVALGLLGQVVTSIVLDTFGLLGMPKLRFLPGQLVGVALVMGGVGVMFFGTPINWFAVGIAALAGVATVLNRTLNAGLSAKTSLWTGTFYNYVTGLAGAALVLALSGEGLVLPHLTAANGWIITGGWIGVCVVLLSSWTVVKMPAFAMTLLMFVGQVFAGVLIDMLSTGSFSAVQAVGGLFAAAGLAVNQWVLLKAAPAETEK